MRKVYCDCCGEQITEKNDATSIQRVLLPDARPNGRIVRLYVNLNLAGREESSEGFSEVDVCKNCILDAIERIDDRPKPASKEISRLQSLLSQREGCLRHVLIQIREMAKETPAVLVWVNEIAHRIGLEGIK